MKVNAEDAWRESEGYVYSISVAILPTYTRLAVLLIQVRLPRAHPTAR